VGPATQTSTAAQIGGPDGLLTADQVRAFVAAQLAAVRLDGRSVCVVVPDGTRTCPLPLLLGAVHRALHGRATRMTALIALGTHTPVDEAALATHLGYGDGTLAGRYPGLEVMNHAWWDPGALVTTGTIPSARVAELSEGRLHEAVPVRVNRALVDHDVTLILGPVFPHEVVGFSGGNKYLVPGVAGREIIDLTHWLGALITSMAIIGRPGTTPVRALIDEAAATIPGERLALCAVTGAPPGSLHSLAFGETREAWAAAAAVSAASHVRYLASPIDRVLSILPARYGDLWTGAKGFYKVEPVVADGGEVVLYAPHITEISPSHPEIAELGYHCRDYFVKQWERFRTRHGSDLAHCTHLNGAGTFDAAEGETRRVHVTLATGIPEAVVHEVNLGYRDPATIDPAAWAADPGILVVPDAGEDLYRLRDPHTDPQKEVP
jgi:nickel-dependent lactate racemase